MPRTPLLGPALVACALLRAAHADPLTLRTSGSLPFVLGELESALALRVQLASAQSPRRIEASVTGDGNRIRIELAGRVQLVTLAGEHGQDAARIVAFAILDLAAGQLDPPGATNDAPVAAPRAAQVAERDDTPLAIRERPSAPRHPRGPAWSVGVWATAGSRNEASIEVAIGIRGRLRAIGSAGASLADTSTAMAVDVTRRAFPVRLGIGWRAGAFELRASALAVVDHASAERSATQAMFGGGAAAVYAVPRTVGGLTVLVGAGGDAFASAVDYRVHGALIATTDRVAWWAGLGIAHEAWR